MTTDGKPQGGSDAPPIRKRIECVTGTCPLSGRGARVIWLLALAALAFVQWPMLKGMFYKTTGAPASESSIRWRDDFDAALAESKATGKPVLVDFSASWCPPCIAMKHDVCPEPEVEKAVADGYVPVLLDADDAGSAEVAARYGVRGIPAVLVVDQNGKVLRRESYMSRSRAIEFLETET